MNNDEILKSDDIITEDCLFFNLCEEFSNYFDFTMEESYDIDELLNTSDYRLVYKVKDLDCSYYNYKIFDSMSKEDQYNILKTTSRDDFSYAYRNISYLVLYDKDIPIAILEVEYLYSGWEATPNRTIDVLNNILYKEFILHVYDILHTIRRRDLINKLNQEYNNNEDICKKH